MATILAHITVRPGCEQVFEELARELYAATHRGEDGVRHYAYFRGAEPRTYYTLLAFDDFQTFMTHQTSDHHESASAGLRDVFESFRLEWLDPVDGASGLPATRARDPPPEAGELRVAYSERFAPEIAAWWHPLRR